MYVPRRLGGGAGRVLDQPPPFTAQQSDSEDGARAVPAAIPISAATLLMESFKKSEEGQARIPDRAFLVAGGQGSSAASSWELASSRDLPPPPSLPPPLRRLFGEKVLSAVDGGEGGARKQHFSSQRPFSSLEAGPPPPAGSLRKAQIPDLRRACPELNTLHPAPRTDAPPARRPHPNSFRPIFSSPRPNIFILPYFGQ